MSRVASGAHLDEFRSLLSHDLEHSFIHRRGDPVSLPAGVHRVEAEPPEGLLRINLVVDKTSNTSLKFRQHPLALVGPAEGA